MLIKRIYFFIIINLLHLPVYAQTLALPRKSPPTLSSSSNQPEGSIGSAAESISSFGQDLGKVFRTASMMTGIAIILFSMIQYGKYRKNSVETPISTVIITLLIGLGLIALSFVPMRFHY